MQTPATAKIKFTACSVAQQITRRHIISVLAVAVYRQEAFDIELSTASIPQRRGQDSRGSLPFHFGTATLSFISTM